MKRAVALAALIAAGCTSVRPTYRAPAPFEAPSQAAAYESARRSASGEPVRMARYLDAARRMKQMAVYSSFEGRLLGDKPGAARETRSGSWTHLGPSNWGGRTRALVLDPRRPATMYAGAVSGGLWKSTDGGASWRALDEFLPVLAVSTLAMDPGDSSVLYAGTGEGFSNSDSIRGAGIFRSTDAGATWAWLESTNTPAFWYVNRIAISPSDNRRLYAATNAGVFRSTDRGDTWEQILDRRAPHRGCHDLVIRTDRPADHVLAACGLSGDLPGRSLLNKTDPGEDPGLDAAVFLNRNAGAGGEWVEVLSERGMSRTSLALAPSNQNVVYAVAASGEPGAYRDGLLAVFRSDQGGEAGTWRARVRNTDPAQLNTLLLSNPFSAQCTAQRTFNSQGRYDNVVAVDPRDPERVWVGGIDLFRSDDGGATWGLATHWWSDDVAQSAHADHHALVFHPSYDGEGNQILFGANDGGVFRTGNARAATARSARAACSPQDNRVRWAPLNEGYAVTQFHRGSIYPGGHAFLGGAQDNGTLRGSEGAGAGEWTRILGGDGTVSAIDPDDPNIFYAAAQNFRLFKSDDGVTLRSATSGITEPAEDFFFVAPLAMDPGDLRRLWTGARRLWRSLDSGARWQAASRVLAERSFSAIAVHSRREGHVLAGTRTGEIFRHASALEADEGSAWEMSRPRTGTVSSIVFDATNLETVYATYSSFHRDPGDAHVYRSGDGGVNWSAIDGSGDAAIPDIPVHSLVIHPDDPARMFVGTDLGIFVSTDGGARWAREESAFPPVPTNRLELRREGRGVALYAITYGRGVWRVRLDGGEPCGYRISPDAIAVSAAGGTHALELDSSEGCEWSALAGAAWARVVTGASGSGPGEVRVWTELNPSSGARETMVVVADKTVAVRQAGAPVTAAADEPATAREIEGIPFAAAVDSRQATSAASDPPHSCTLSRDSRTIWFRYTASESGRVIARAIGYRTGTSTILPLVVTAYSTSPPDHSVPGGEAACDQNPGAGFQPAQIVFAVETGRSYLIEVSVAGTASPGGSIVFTLARTEARLEPVPAALDFGTVPVGQTARRRLLIRNAGNVPLLLQAAAADAPFGVAGLGRAVALRQGGLLEAEVLFTPAGEGVHKSAVTLTVSGELAARTVELRGAGTAAQ